MAETVFRHYVPSDFEAVIKLCQACLPHEDVTPEKFVLQVLNDPNFRAEGASVAVSGEDTVGFIYSVHRTCPVDGPDVLDSDTGYIVLLAVDEAFRRQLVGTSLLTIAEDYLRSCRASRILVGPYSPFYFAPGVGCEYEDGLAFFPAQGYVEAGRPLAMKTSLDPLTWPDWIDKEGFSIEVYKWHPEITLPLLAFARDEFGPDWARFVSDAVRDVARGDSPRRLLTAIEDGRVVAFSHYDQDRFGPIGVHPDYRGRKIGQFLCWQTLMAMSSAGHKEAYFLWSNDETAERLYNGFGFKEWRRFVTFKKEI